MNIRTTKPGKGNKFYITKSKGGYSTCIQGKPTDSECDVLANCVGYACGRFNEIIGSMKYPSLNCNAENFIERAKNTYGLEVANYPVVGGIMVWQKGTTLSGNDGAGHVAIVEKYIDKNTIYTSESGYGGSAFWNSKRTNSNGRWGLGSGYTFRGCIVNPVIGKETYVDPTPTPTPTTQKFAIGEKVVINGVLYTSSTGDTKGATVKNKVTNITRYNAGSKHPYNTTGDLGWMDESSISKYNEPKKEEIKVGDIVVPTKLVDYRGKAVVQWDKTYEVLQIDNRGAVLGAVRGSQRPVWAVLPLSNIKKV